MNINRSKVQVHLFDVAGKRLNDDIEISLYNQRLDTLSRRHRFRMNGRAIVLKDVPAFPHGRHEAYINPGKYRAKSIFITVPAGRLGLIGSAESKDETLLVDPAKVSPNLPTLSTIQSGPRWRELARVLTRSKINSEAQWKQLGDEKRAGLLNLYAKMQRENVVADNGREKTVFSFVDRITEFLPARIFCRVSNELLGLVRGDTRERYRSVSGALHEFPDPWQAIGERGSFKTPDRAGNLQLTFARSGASSDEGFHLVDADIDDHAGIQHAFDVLKHKITQSDTHPYDIHQILIYFQDLKPGYDLG